MPGRPSTPDSTQRSLKRHRKHGELKMQKCELPGEGISSPGSSWGSSCQTALRVGQRRLSLRRGARLETRRLAVTARAVRIRLRWGFGGLLSRGFGRATEGDGITWESRTPARAVGFGGGLRLRFRHLLRVGLRNSSGRIEMGGAVDWIKHLGWGSFVGWRLREKAPAPSAETKFTLAFRIFSSGGCSETGRKPSSRCRLEPAHETVIRSGTI